MLFRSKINTVVAPVIFALYDYRQGYPFKGRRLGHLAALFSISVIFAALHIFSFFWSSTSLAKSDLGGSYYGSPGVHLKNIPFLVFFYLRMVVFPHPLTAWHMFRVQETFNWILAAGWIGMFAMAWILYRSNRNVQFWSLWFVVFLAPVLQIVPNLTWVAERYLYIPAIGAFVLLGKGFFFVWDRIPAPRFRWLWEFGMIAALLALVWRTESYLPAFRDDLTLWEATAKTCPTSAACRQGLGDALLKRNQIERGMKEMIQAVEIRGTAPYLGSLGDAFTLRVGDFRQGIIAYRMALENGGPSTPSRTVELYSKLARAYVQTGQLEEAAAALQAARRINPDDAFLLVVSSFLEWKLGNLPAARAALEKALYISDQRSAIGRFLYDYWGNAAEVGRFLAAVRPAPAAISQK